MKMAETVELKPCPCGSVDKVAMAPGGNWHIECQDCGYITSGVCGTFEEAAVVWNTRSDPAVRDRVTDEMVERVRERYTCAPVPPCSVCGELLSIQSTGGGNATVYGCQNHSPVDMEHYGRSRWTQFRPGDQDVLDIIAALRTSPPEPASGLPQEIIVRYLDMVPGGIKAICVPNPGTDLCHLRWMLEQLQQPMERGKAMRWLGFIQGVLIERGFTTVDAERGFTRPYFSAPTPPAKEPQ